MSKAFILAPFVSREMVKINNEYLFVFGDNERRYGLDDQAKEMRGEENCFGIRTKVIPSHIPSAFWYDRDFTAKTGLVIEDIKNVLTHLPLYRGIVVPLHGVGTVLSKLHINAPRILEYINDSIEFLKATCHEED